METVFINESKAIWDNWDNIPMETDTVFIEEGDVTKIIDSILCFIVLFHGIFGSVATCFVLTTKRNMKTPLYIYLLSFAISDLMFCVAYIPFLIFHLVESWTFGSLLCYSSTLLVEMHDYYTAIAMSFSLLVFTLGNPNLKTTYYTIAFAVLAATLFTLPKVLVTSVQVYGDYKYCLSYHEYIDMEISSEILKCLTGIGLPLSMIMYWAYQSRFLSWTDQNASSGELIMLATLINIILESPLYALTFLNFLGYVHFNVYISVLIAILALLSVVYKPLLYYKMDNNFKREVLGLTTRRLYTSTSVSYSLQEDQF